MSRAVSDKASVSDDLLDTAVPLNVKTNDNLEFVQEVLNCSPNISAILNENNQVILTNSHLVKMSGLETIEALIGKRPGKVISCIHCELNDCGTSENCKFCSIINTIKQCRTSLSSVSNECRVTSCDNEKITSYDFKVTCSPVRIKGRPYTLMNLEDISSEKRKAILENVFFHDILNRLGGFNGMIQLIKNSNLQPELNEYVEMLETIGEMVVEDIQTQRYLKSAESDTLILNLREYTAKEIIESVRKQVSFDPVMNASHLKLVTSYTDFSLSTDSTLLRRILLNMVKNAAEASPANGTVTISAFKRDRKIYFSVHNSGNIHPDIKQQIFQRSFTTKGLGRGLGTYSMKLFGENYLKGKVSFTSADKAGTMFTIELPVI